MGWWYAVDENNRPRCLMMLVGRSRSCESEGRRAVRYAPFALSIEAARDHVNRTFFESAKKPIIASTTRSSNGTVGRTESSPSPDSSVVPSPFFTPSPSPFFVPSPAPSPSPISALLLFLAADLVVGGDTALFALVAGVEGVTLALLSGSEGGGKSSLVVVVVVVIEVVGSGAEADGAASGSGAS